MLIKIKKGKEKKKHFIGMAKVRHLPQEPGDVVSILGTRNSTKLSHPLLSLRTLTFRKGRGLSYTLVVPTPELRGDARSICYHVGLASNPEHRFRRS